MKKIKPNIDRMILDLTAIALASNDLARLQDINYVIRKRDVVGMMRELNKEKYKL